ncbi:hypothetical protein [Polaribacter sargassicola]|uniref:hypothetical protein n=1 Tax=Polaribacter sargassicola TaxID=2836891 RepID=UPI001F2A1979|nr:hypothetical protein [Polaribacter sp. DS7-9]MCG1036229.1 hypothetical protein [Polaribacter sp. DS7-9]
MKKIVSILVLVMAVTFTTQAQRKGGQKGPKFTPEQQATLAVKKMALALDLTDKQQNQIKPILTAQIEERKAEMEKRKANKDEPRQKPTADELFAMQNKRLDNQIMMKNKMKNILNEEQFEKFEKMQKGRKMMAMKGKKGDKDNFRRGNRTQRGK